MYKAVWLYYLLTSFPLFPYR